MFLTLEDPRAKIKGSRDPLGVQTVWAGFGRHVVTNLTTVANSLRGFTVLLLGRYLGERLLEERKIDGDQVLDVFLRAEQVGGYARYITQREDSMTEGRILGIERITRRVAESSGSVPIDATVRGTILSDQKTYGLWGLFSVSARVSGLLPEGPIGVTQPARGFIETHYLPLLEPVLPKVNSLVKDGGALSTRKNDPVVAAFGRILSVRLSKPERDFYGEYLRDAEHLEPPKAPGRQARFRELLERHTKLDEGVTRRELEAVARAAKDIDPGLADRIRRILHLEALLAPCETIFGLLLTRHGQRPAQVAESLHERWGRGMPNLDSEDFDDIRDEAAAHAGERIAAAMAIVHGALARGEYAEAIDTLIDWNRIVMAHRGSAPWVRLGPDGAIDVRYRGGERPLPARDELPTLWGNSYFINSLKAITAQINGGAGGAAQGAVA